MVGGSICWGRWPYLRAKSSGPASGRPCRSRPLQRVEVADIGPDGPTAVTLSAERCAAMAGPAPCAPGVDPNSAPGLKLGSLPAVGAGADTNARRDARAAACPRAARGSSLRPLTADERSAPSSGRSAWSGALVGRLSEVALGWAGFGAGGQCAGSTGRVLTARRGDIQEPATLSPVPGLRGRQDDAG